MPARVLLSRRAVRDLTGLGAGRPRIERLLRSLTEEPQPANVDIKVLQGRAPWSRARVGPYRVILRPLTAAEAEAAVPAGVRAYLVARIVHRRDLEKAIAKL